MPPAHNARAFAAGSKVEVVTAHRNTSIKAGQFLVVVARAGVDNKSAHVQVFDDEADADHGANLALGEEGDEAQFQLEFKEMSRTVLNNVLGSDLFLKVLVPLPSDYHGHVAKGISLPISNDEGAFIGVVVVDATIHHVDGEFSFVFEHEGVEYTVPTSENACKASLELKEKAVYPTYFSPAIFGPTLSGHVKCMAESAALPADQLCALELHEMLVAADMVTSGLLDPSVPAEAAQLVGMAYALKPAAVKVVTSEGLLPAAVGMLFAKEMKRLASTPTPEGGLGGGAPAGVPSPPTWISSVGESNVLTRAFATLARDEIAWREFLVSSWNKKIMWHLI